MKKTTRNNIIILIVCLIIMATTFFVSRNCLVVYPVSGYSMEPNLHDEERILLFRTQNVDYGDIIVFYYQPLEKYLVKRVIGLEGDKIDIKFDYDEKQYRILRNGEELVEDYIKEPMTDYETMSVVVPAGKIFFLGDNRNVSRDSHSGLLADVDQVEGVAFFKYSGEKIAFIKNK